MDYGASGPSKVIWDGGILSGETAGLRPVGRQKQIRRITVCLSPMRQGQSPINAWLYGPPGSGKTLVARWTVEEACSSGTRIGVYVNCGQHKSLYPVLHAIIDQMKILGAETQYMDVKFETPMPKVVVLPAEKAARMGVIRSDKGGIPWNQYGAHESVEEAD